MAIVKTIPSRKVINGFVVDTSEISVVSELDYKTNGESCIVIRGVSESTVILDSTTTDKIKIKTCVNINE